MWYRHTSPNEPAFPRPCGAANKEEGNLEQDGMTLREWYVGMALSGLMAHACLEELITDSSSPQKAADICYAMADAMLERGRLDSVAKPSTSHDED